ncbi:hypothetical protein CH299_18640 [Rhodococcus sp. 14-2686-1-2]|nr:hypothetical protein CH301_17945 [Rhodococcus sp. 15-1189-1-1a]OZF12140.1 hypothetical protein CH299_18640 [Rhodococcus sp. 14-2686-1-2]
MRMDERLVGLAYERTRRMAPKGIAVTDKRVRIYSTYHNPKVGLLSIELPAKVDIPLDSVTKIVWSGTEWVSVVAETTGEHKLRLTRSRDAKFVAEKIAASAGVAITRAARATDVGGSDSRRDRHSSPVLGDAWLEKRSPRFQDRFTAVFGVVFAALSLCLGGFVLYLFGSWVFGGSDTDSHSSRCDELEEWYVKQPYDSNPGIARDYYNSCDAMPPPVINGELIFRNGDFVYR